MSIVVKASPYNPIPLVQKDELIPETVSYVHPRRALHGQNLEPAELNKTFYQPVNREDTVCLQYKRGVNGTLAWNYTVLNFYDREGKFIDFITAPTETYSIAGDVDEFNEQLYTEQFTFKPTNYAYLDNHDHVSIAVLAHFGDGSALATGDTVYILTSGIIHLADYHDGTCLVKYSRGYNTRDTFFEFPEIFPKFMIRLPAGRMRTIPAGEYTVFKEQGGVTVPLDTTPQNKYEWTVIDVPVRYFDILNYALPCDNVNIDGFEYALEEDGRGEGDKDKPRQTVTYVFTDKDISKTLSFDKKTYTLWTEPSYPYAISALWIMDGYSGVFLPSHVFYDTAGVDAYIDLLEAQITAIGANGVFIRDAGVVYYQNASGEAYKPLFTTQVKPDLLIVTHLVTDISFGMQISIKHPDTLPHLIIGKDATGNGAADNEFTNSGAFTSLVKTYSSTGSKTLHLFHNNDFIEFSHLRSLSYPAITDITGSISSTLNKFEIAGEDLSAHATFPLTFLAPAKYTLRTLIMRFSGIQGITATWASALISGSIKPYSLIYVDVRDNSFDVTNVDAFINEYYNSCDWIPYSIIFLTVGQSPAAVPAASAAAITDLTNNYGAFFSTD